VSESKSEDTLMRTWQPTQASYLRPCVGVGVGVRPAVFLGVGDEETTWLNDIDDVADADNWIEGEGDAVKHTGLYGILTETLRTSSRH